MEEWLNRQGYFTIRGIKIGVHEIDLIAIKSEPSGLKCRHVEVQVSVNPVSYISKLTKADQKTLGRAATSSAHREFDVLSRGAAAWVEKKFLRPDKRRMLQQLAPGPWSKELVIHKARHQEEIQLFEELGVQVHGLEEILLEMQEASGPIMRASGGDFLDLVFLGKGFEYSPGEAPVDDEPENDA